MIIIWSSRPTAKRLQNVTRSPTGSDRSHMSYATSTNSHVCYSHVGCPTVSTGKEINSCDWPGHVRGVGWLTAVLATVLATFFSIGRWRSWNKYIHIADNNCFYFLVLYLYTKDFVIFMILSIGFLLMKYANISLMISHCSSNTP